MTRIPPTEYQENIEKQAVLNTYMYLDIKVKDGSSLNDIVKMINSDDKYASVRDKGEFQIIQKSLKEHEEWGNLIIGNQEIPSYSDPLAIGACTFKDPVSNEINVVYRGTSDGEWYSNAELLFSDHLTKRAELAIDYFDRIYEKECLGNNMNINVSGHSNGGNDTTTVLFGSKYGGEINQAISYDGQGYSQEIIEYFENLYGKEYFENQKKKVIGINGEDDFVNTQGISIIDDKNKYYIRTPSDSNFDVISYHDLKYMFADGKGGYNGKLNNYCNQGEIGKFSANISKDIMNLPPEERKGAMVSVMSFIEWVNGGRYKNEDMYGRCATFQDFMDLLNSGGPIIFVELLLSKDGLEVLYKYYDELMQMIQDDPILAFKLALVVIVCTPFLMPVLATFELVYGVLEIVDLSIDLSNMAKEFLKNCYDGICQFVKGAEKWYNENFNEGYKYAYSHPYISVNTDKLDSYATRLLNVNRRLTELDRRIHQLYGKVKLKDIYDLIQSDLIINYSITLKLCSNYLSNTSKDFKNVEKEILKKG